MKILCNSKTWIIYYVFEIYFICTNSEISIATIDLQI